MTNRLYYSDDARTQVQRRTGLLMMFSLFLGATLGMIGALLFAPKEGQALRNDLMESFEDRVDELEAGVAQVRDELADRQPQLN